MRISNAQYLIFAGIFQLAISICYVLVCLSNYSFEWLTIEFVKELQNNEILQIKSERDFDPNLTWGLAGLNGIMFFVYWVIYTENEANPKPAFISKDFGVGTLPFFIALFYYIFIDYRNDLIFLLTGCFAVPNIFFYLSYKIQEKRQIRKS
jgi:lipid-A-disaccharide synthase-like uncharacterized protein